MDIIKKMEDRDELQEEILKYIRSSEFFKNLFPVIKSGNYDLFLTIVGKEIVQSIILSDVVYLDKNRLRLMLHVRYRENYPTEFPLHSAHNLQLDVPISFFNVFSLKKMEKWALELSNSNRANLVICLENELKCITEKLNKLKE